MLKLLTQIFQPDLIARKVKGKKNVIVLLYHSPEADTFEQHVEYLNQYYRFISLQDLVDAIRTKDWSNIPQNALVFTFDDGHISNYDLIPIFKQFKITPTIYLVSNVVGTNNKFWWQEELELDEKESLKLLSNKERLKIIKDRKSTNNNINDNPVALTRDQIIEMSAVVDFQSHTKNHPIVTMLDDDELEEELKSPLNKLKDFDLEVKHFAYPNGDYSTREVEYLKKVGYHSARTIDIGWNNKDTDLYRMKIMGISDNASIPKLRLQVSGLFGWIFHIRYSGNFIGKKEIITPNH